MVFVGLDFPDRDNGQSQGQCPSTAGTGICFRTLLQRTWRASGVSALLGHSMGVLVELG